MPARLVGQLVDGAFKDPFVAKRRFADWLAGAPVHVVTARAALLGAAVRVLERTGEG